MGQADAQQFVMDMPAVGIKGRKARGHPHAENAHRVERRDENDSQEDGWRRVDPVKFAVDVQVIELQPEERDYETQQQRAGIAHKNFHPVPHHVIEKEDGHHAPHCHRHHRIHIDVVGEEPDPEREQREDREPGAKPVDAVDQVVRIGQQNDHQHRQQRAHSRRHMVQPEQAVVQKPASASSIELSTISHTR